ncbi:TonB-dependent receptor [Emcibacter sp.]|uniref:TonB-dependent receptor n=1 Tax=Emcibacter sp. TaxID=1979954 RepID=UPI002AA7C9D9|nr:TonB-dependent receptor [Emcibacter sp.]
MTKKLSKSLLLATVAACSLAEVTPAMAQMVLEEITVTARKREESIMKVPVTTSVLSGDTLDQYAITDVAGVADKTPGLNFSNGPTASGVLVSMRGIGTGTNNPAIDQSIAFVIDGMQFTQGLAFEMATLDMAQVEVMKGPQALFFGKAAPAGVIAVRTADPGEEFEVKLRAGYEFEAQERMGEFVISGPVTDTLGLRLAAQYSKMDGYFTNDAEVGNSAFGSLGAAPVTYQEFPNKEQVMVRGTMVWNPSDNFKARLKLNYSDMEIQGFGSEPQLVSCPDGTDSFFSFLGLSFIGGETCDVDGNQTLIYMDPDSFPGIYNDGVPFADVQQFFGSLEMSYDFGNDLTLSSVTGFYDVDQSSMFNGSITTSLGSPFAIQGKMDRRDFTQELRLTSDYAGDVNFMAGAFYQKGETNFLSSLPANQAWLPLLGVLRPGASWPPALAWADHSIDSETVSLFGQVLWKITPELEIGAGVRWTDEQRSHNVVNRLLERFDLGPALPVTLARPELSSSNWSPEVSIAYTPTDELTIYANFKRAYKSGSFDVGGGANNGDDKAFDDETVRGGEFGVKALLADGALIVNAATYYYEYDDMQVETRVFDPENGSVAVRTVNAASSEIYGIDLDATYAVPGVDGLTLYGAVNWNTAKYTDFDNAQCYTGQTFAAGCNIDLNDDGIGDAQSLTGEPLLRAPKWMANAGFDYQTDVSNDLTLSLASNLSYSDSYSASSTNIADAYQDSYVKLSANIGLGSNEDGWRVELIGDNLTDKYVYGNCAPAGYADSLLMGQDAAFAGTGAAGGPGGSPETACFTSRGRSVWLRLTVNLN